jgi:hypothetical protein
METQAKVSSKEVVLSYIKMLDSQKYDAVRPYLSEKIRIWGPGGETFSKSEEFIGMLSQYHGKYDLKKVFWDGDDVCVLYNLITPVATVFMSSWYQIKEGKITSIQTIFDPRQFASGSRGNGNG